MNIPSRARRPNLPPTLKYLSLGLLIGIGVSLAFFTTIGYTAFMSATITPTQPEQTSPTNTPFLPPTATPLPTPTGTPLPTATPNSIQTMINSGQLFFYGPLSMVQQITLYQSSLSYIATDTRQSTLLSKEINGLQYGNPSNTCGPLAIAIMRDAGLVSADINPHDFWLLNPNTTGGRQLLDQVFPSDRYSDTRIRTPLNKFNWLTYPLQSGDFVYIYSGTGGNFDHMLVVNRVDNDLRAYAVTNFDTSDGFIMNEVMLYDPNNSNTGIFHTWTESQFALLGSTGFGGFEVWRLRN